MPDDPNGRGVNDAFLIPGSDKPVDKPHFVNPENELELASVIPKTEEDLTAAKVSKGDQLAAADLLNDLEMLLSEAKGYVCEPVCLLFPSFRASNATQSADKRDEPETDSR